MESSKASVWYGHFPKRVLQFLKKMRLPFPETPNPLFPSLPFERFGRFVSA